MREIFHKIDRNQIITEPDLWYTNPMNVHEAKAILAKIDPLIELEFDGESKTLTLLNIEASKRFGMGYAWHAYVKLEGNKAIEKTFECHTADTSTGVYHQSLPAPEPLQAKLDSILEKLHILS